MQVSDEYLVEAYLERGDQNAFRLLVQRHQERIYGYLLGMVHDRETANDLFQETFLRVVAAMGKQRGQYTIQGRWVAWVMRIARNAALDYLRSRKKWVDVDQDGRDEEEGSFWDRLASDGQLPDDLLTTEEQLEKLSAGIDRLPPEQREVVLLRHDSELTFREIAELTGCSINTALGRMRYALINLRKMLTEDVTQAATYLN